MISLGQLKSINVYFSGQVNNPGISLVHPFSDIFTSLAQAGGINPNGSLRNVQLIRNNKIINTIDFYSFFLDGKNNFSNLKIIDGDVIHVPSYHRRVEVAGEVINEGFYEVLENETIVDAISFAGGLTEKASSKAILNTITPIEFRVADDNAFSNTLVSYEEFSSFNFNDGYKITFLKIPEVKTNVQVFGRVKSPGLYPSNNNSLKDVLEVAGGFNDPTFLKTINLDEIIILRKDENNFYAKEIVTKYENSENVMLMPEDKIFVYEQTNYRNIFSYRVEGEVSKPGTYPLKKGITVSDAIKLAGGITELSDNLNIVLYQEFTEIDDTGKEVLSLKPVNDTQLDFELGINSVIKVIPKENVVNVAGNVYSPGLVAYSKKLTASKAIELAGGYKPYSLKNRVYIKRANGNIEQIGFLGGRSFRLYPGDSIYVPENPSPSDFKVDEFIANLSVTLANLAAIFVVIDKN